MHKYHPEPIKNLLYVRVNGGPVSLFGSELFHPKDMEGLAVQTKWARGNNTAPHWLTDPLCAEHVWISASLKKRITSNGRLWWFERKKDGSSHPAVDAIRNLHTLLRTHTKTVKLPLKIEQLRTLGSFHESLIWPEWLRVKMKGERVKTCQCAAWISAHEPCCLQEGVALYLDLQFKHRLPPLLRFELGTSSEAGVEICCCDSLCAIKFCWRICCLRRRLQKVRKIKIKEGTSAATGQVPALFLTRASLCTPHPKPCVG